MNNHYLRNPTTKLDVTNYKTGCARPTAVAPKPLDLWRCFQGKSWRKYLYFAYKSGFKGLRAILRAVEAVKVKLWCFKGIVHPTHFQKQVGWGTWLLDPTLVAKIFQRVACFCLFLVLPNLFPQLANFLARIYPSYPWHFATLILPFFHIPSVFIIWPFPLDGNAYIFFPNAYEYWSKIYIHEKNVYSNFYTIVSNVQRCQIHVCLQVVPGGEKKNSWS